MRRRIFVVIMKGIILAGGNGSRLYPMTKVISKQLIPIYDKPMIYYSLSTLLLSGIKDVLIISTPFHLGYYKELLQDGTQLGINISYLPQEQPRGLAEAFIIGESFIGDDSVALALGDNIFHGNNFRQALLNASRRKEGATVFGTIVSNPSAYGVVSFDGEGNVIDIEEKPKNPKSNWAVPGIYFYDNSVIEIAKNIEPSARGELEITSVNNEYLKRGKLYLQKLGRGVAWLDTGTCTSLLQASQYVETIQNMQGLYVSCIEEICYRLGYITKQELYELAKQHSGTSYSEYLMKVALGEVEERLHEI